MKFKFNLPYENNPEVEIIKSAFSGKLKVFVNGKEMERLKEKGKPFEIILDNGDTKKMLVKPNGFDFAPKVFIDDQQIYIVEKLKTHEYIIGGIPLLLAILGGALGGGIGALGVIFNYMIFRTNMPTVKKYLSIIGIIICSVIIYLITTTLFFVLFYG